MGRWREHLKADPLPYLLSCDSEAINYWALRDLQGEDVGPPSVLWNLPPVRKLLLKQQSNGSWKYPGGKKDIRTQENYNLLETFRQTGELTGKFGCTREQPPIGKAAEYIFSFQTGDGDFRGIYGSQYATTYHGAIMEVLIQAGYADDPRIDKGFRWLLSMRQDDGGWAIPLRTRGYTFGGFAEAMKLPEPVGPDRSKPFSHLITGMALRAFAAHPERRQSPEARAAGELLLSRLYKKDAYPDRGSAAYWERVSFPFWFTDIVSALDTLYWLGFTADEPAIKAALGRLAQRQRPDGTFDLKLLKTGGDRMPDAWVCLAASRLFRYYYG